MAKKSKAKEKEIKQQEFDFEEEKERKEEEIVEETEELEENDEIEEEVEEESEEDTDSEEDSDEDDSDEEASEEDDDEEFEDEDSDDEDDDEEDLDDESDEDSEDDEDDDDEDEDSEEEKEIEANPIKKTMSDKTRYLMIGLGTLILVVLVVVIIVLAPKNNNESSSSNSNKSVEDRNLSTDALKEFYKQFDSEKLNVIFFASSTCGYCNLEKPIIEAISKDYDMKYYAIDASKLSNAEITEISSALGIRGATPTTVIVKKGEVVATNEGYLDGQPFVKFFADNGVLPKDAVYKDEANLKSISYSEFKKKAKEDKTNLFLLDQSACAQCTTVRSLLNKLSKDNKFNVYYISAANLTSDDIKDLVEKDLKNMKYDEKTYKEKGEVNIPLLLVVKNNKIKDYVLESTDEADYTKVLKKYNFIKK